ncbi:MAG: hypothetical protein HUU55_13130 [Myxococcales bacterium]|nr:hypothetical protein [Myxococcales bacterium]
MRTSFVFSGKTPHHNVGVVILCVLVSIPLTAGADPAFDKLEKRVNSLFFTLKQEQEKTAMLQSTVEALQAEVATLQGDNAELVTTVFALQQQVAELQNNTNNPAICPVGQAPICCPTDTTLCGNDGCVDILTDPNHCGGCGAVCDSGNCVEGKCAPAVCEDEVVFAVGVFGTTTCANNCQAVGKTCIGIGSDEGASDGQYFECSNATGGIGTTLANGTCDTVLGGQGCSEYTNCRCDNPTCSICGNGLVEQGEVCDDGNTNDGDSCSADCMTAVCEDEVVFAVGVFGTTTCANNCQAVGKTCIGIGSDDGATNGQYYECGNATGGVGTTLANGTCNTVLGGQGCSEYTQCLCDNPTCSICGNGLVEQGEVCDDGNTASGDGCNADCTAIECIEETVFAVGVFGTTTCSANCQAVGKVCVGIGTDDNASNDVYYQCGNATGGVGTTLAPGTCTTVLGGQGCSEYTQCACLSPACFQ